MLVSRETQDLYPICADIYGDWKRDVPWRPHGRHMVTTYSRVAADGKRQVAQARLRLDIVGSDFAAIDLAGLLRAADYRDRTGAGRPAWRRQRS